MNKKVLNKLINQTDSKKLTRYIRFSETDIEKNKLKIKSAVDDLKSSQEIREQLDSFVKKPHTVPSVSIFADEEKGNITAIDKMRIPYEGDFHYKRYYTLPLFNYQNEIYDNLYLLVFSQKFNKLFKVNYNNLTEIELEEMKNFSKVMQKREENKSIQHHGKENVVFHGQNAPTEKDRESHVLERHIRSISEMVSNEIEKENGKLLVAGPRENIDRIENQINESLRLPIKLVGNFDHYDKEDFLKDIRHEISDYGRQFAKEIKNKVDISEATKLQNEDFLDILSVIYDAKVEKVYIGKLGLDEKDFTNPISPLGANYISQEVMKLGGEVRFYPDIEFESSNNNLIFQFRK